MWHHSPKPVWPGERAWEHFTHTHHVLVSNQRELHLSQILLGRHQVCAVNK